MTAAHAAVAATEAAAATEALAAEVAGAREPSHSHSCSTTSDGAGGAQGGAAVDFESPNAPATTPADPRAMLSAMLPPLPAPSGGVQEEEEEAIEEAVEEAVEEEHEDAPPPPKRRATGADRAPKLGGFTARVGASGSVLGMAAAEPSGTGTRQAAQAAQVAAAEVLAAAEAQAAAVAQATALLRNASVALRAARRLEAGMGGAEWNWTYGVEEALTAARHTQAADGEACYHLLAAEACRRSLEWRRHATPLAVSVQAVGAEIASLGARAHELATSATLRTDPSACHAATASAPDVAHPGARAVLSDPSFEFDLRALWGNALWGSAPWGLPPIGSRQVASSTLEATRRSSAALAEERAVLGVKQELWRGLLRELEHHHAALTFRERYHERTKPLYTARSVS